MLTDKRIFTKLPQILKRYERLRYETVSRMDVELFETRDYLTQEPEGVAWTPAPVGTAWGAEWMTGWFRGDVILPAVERFLPQMVLVSTGYDSHGRDPLGGMSMTTDGYRRIMRQIIDAANGVCDGKIAMTLEGGYDLTAMRECTEAQLEEMVAG